MNIEVERSALLKVFLGERGYPGYRASLLLCHCTVTLLRRDTAPRRLIAPDDLEFRLRPHDLIILPDTIPATYEQALQAVPETEYRDYAFVPGTTPFDNEMRTTCERRPQTVVLSPVSMNSVQGFLRMIRSSADITGPVRDLLLCSHANPEGRLIMAFQTESTAAGFVSYEELEGLCSSGVVHVPQEARFPRPQTTAGTRSLQVHFRGCRVGRNAPFMAKLREALDVPLVTAPRHYHSTAILDNPAGAAELMLYSFEVFSRDRIEHTPALIDAFAAKGYRTVDGAQIRRDSFARWINWTDASSARTGRMQEAVSPVNNLNYNVRAPFRYSHRYLDEQGGFSVNLPSEPVTDADKKRAVKAELQRRYPQYRPDHPWPEYVRLGYDSMDEFMEGWNWHFSLDQAEGILMLNPSRHEYILSQPVVTADNRLYMNFYYNDVSRQPLIQIREDDDRFFGRAATTS